MKPFRWVWALWVAFLIPALGCEPDPPAPLAEAALLRLQCDQLMVGLEHYLTAEGIRRAHVLADTACFLENRSTVLLSKARMTFYGSEGEVASTLTSDSATYEWLTGDMEALGNVVVVDPETGRRVETSVLYYERAREQIWSDRRTKMTEPDGTVVEGVGFRSSSGLDRVEMESARLTRPARPAGSSSAPGSPGS